MRAMISPQISPFNASKTAYPSCHLDHDVDPPRVVSNHRSLDAIVQVGRHADNESSKYIEALPVWLSGNQRVMLWRRNKASRLTPCAGRFSVLRATVRAPNRPIAEGAVPACPVFAPCPFRFRVESYPRRCGKADTVSPSSFAPPVFAERMCWPVSLIATLSSWAAV